MSPELIIIAFGIFMGVVLAVIFAMECFEDQTIALMTWLGWRKTPETPYDRAFRHLHTAWWHGHITREMFEKWTRGLDENGLYNPVKTQPIDKGTEHGT